MLRMPDAYTRIRGWNEGFDARQHARAGWHLPSYHPGWSLEARYHRLFRPDDQPDLIARSGACGPYDPHPDYGGDHDRHICAISIPRMGRVMICPEANALVVVLLGILLAGLVAEHTELQTLRSLATNYITMAPQQLATPDVVTAHPADYRAFDTLGEVAVLFMVAAGVGLILGRQGEARDAASTPEPDATVRRARLSDGADAAVSSDIDVCGLHHHEWSPVGRRRLSRRRGIGVRCYAAVACRPNYPLNVGILGATELLAGVLFVVAGIAGLIFAGGFWTAVCFRSASSVRSSALALYPCSRSCSVSKSAASSV